MSPELEVQEVELDALVIAEDRVTANYDEHELEALRASIAAEGVRDPLDVVRVGGRLIIVDGWNRFRIAHELGYKTIRCRIKEGTEKDAMLENLVRNLQRGRNRPADMARIALQLRDKHGLGSADIATRTGLSRGWVEQLLELEHLQPWVRDLLDAGNLRVGVAMELARILDGDVQIRAAQQALNIGWTVPRAREMVGLILEELRKPVAERRPIEEVAPLPPECQLCGPVPPGMTVAAPIVCAACWSAILQANRDAAALPQEAAR